MTGPIVNGERFAPGYTREAAEYEQATRPEDDDDPGFYWMNLDHANVADLTRSIAETLSPLGTEDTALYGIVSERDGGIIAYAIGRSHAVEITNALLARVVR